MSKIRCETETVDDGRIAIFANPTASTSAPHRGIDRLGDSTLKSKRIQQISTFSPHRLQALRPAFP
jgi:hypothetical protein